MSANRVEYYDFLRGIAIVFVIAIHSFSPFAISESNTLSYHLGIIWRQIIGCAVPIFLAISGYFMSNKDLDSQEKYHAFLKKQIPRVYLPMLIWSLPYLLYSYFNDVNILKSLIWFFIAGYSVYYFIILIVQYYLLLPKLQLLAAKSKGMALFYSGISSVACMVLLFYLTRILNISIPLVAYAGLFPVWILFFVLGIYLEKNKIQLSSKKLITFTILGLIISVAETYFTIWFTGSFTGLGIKIGAFIYSFFAIILLFSLNKDFSSNSIIWKGMVYIGKISFGIYLTHMYFMTFLVRPLASHFQTDNYFWNQLTILGLTLFLCILLIYMGKKVNNRLVVKYLGF